MSRRRGWMGGRPCRRSRGVIFAAVSRGRSAVSTAGGRGVGAACRARWWGGPLTQHGENFYGLDGRAQPHDGNAFFGGKTSIDHFNDDASFRNIPFGAPPVVWDDMIYPPTHPFHGQSIDLAFALTTVPEPG